jgi:hypothetical protein
MKKLLKWIGIVIGGLLLLVIIAGVAIMFIVDKAMIDTQMEKALNRQVSIGDVNISVFSVLSGIEVKDVRISNFKTPKALEALKDKPVPEGDLFVGLKAFTFKLRFMPLLSGKVELRELLLSGPVVNVVRYKSGLFNFSDLTAPKKMTPEEKAELLEKQKEEAKKKVEEAKKPKEPQKPFGADDLPVEITVGKVGLEKGTITVVDQGLNQTIQLYNMTALVHDIAIDPKNLAQKDSVKLKVETGVKTIGQIKTGSVKSFDIGIALTGTVIPFDKKTRLLEPEVSAKLGSPYGTATGLQVFDAMKNVESLQKYCGKLSFLKDDIKWKDGFVNVWYKAGVAKLSDGRIKADDFLLTFQGMINTVSKALDMDMNMLLEKRHAASIEKGIEGNVQKAISAAKADKLVKSDQVTKEAMKRLTNKDGLVYLQYKLTGTTNSPKSTLVHPKLPTMKDLIKEAAGDVAGAARDKAKEEGTKAAKDSGKKAEKKLGKELKKTKLKF